ncbi:MAG: sigma-70 family RNA polymerase sigma factor [Roseiflexaceae bacterium]
MTLYEQAAQRGTTIHRPVRTMNDTDTTGWEAEIGRSRYEEVDDTLRQYLHTIGQIPLLTAEQEVALASAISDQVDAQRTLSQGGLATPERFRLEQQVAQGEEARRQLIQANLRLVISIARRYIGSGMGLMDLIQEGNIGLMRAVEKFDHRKGNRFSTYATWWIRQAIRRAVENQSRTVRLPSHLNSTLGQIGAARARLHQKLHREPTFDELAVELDMSPDKIAATLSAAQAPISLERPLNDETDSCFGDLIEDTRMQPLYDQVAGSLLHEELQARMERMPARERAIVELRYGLKDGRPRTLEEVGAAFGITRERARQLEERALGLLRPMAGTVAAPRRRTRTRTRAALDA